MQSVYIVYAVIILAVYLMYTKQSVSESFEGDKEQKKLCRVKAKRSLWSKYDWQTRIKVGDVWKCPLGWQGTGCDWGMGTEFELKQCRRLKNSPAKGMSTKTAATNPLCTSGVRVFSEYGFTSTDKYPTQIIPCGPEVVLPLVDGKSGYSSMIVPKGLTATVKFTIPVFSTYDNAFIDPIIETKTYEGPVEINFEGSNNDTATSITVALT